jgi:hypothetical protein
LEPFPFYAENFRFEIGPVVVRGITEVTPAPLNSL